jgi:hypothetical protein
VCNAGTCEASFTTNACDDGVSCTVGDTCNNGVYPSFVPASAWTVFPNPTDYYLQLETNFTGSWHYELRDALGRTVLWGQTDQPALRVDLPLLTAGIYWLNVYLDDGATAAKKVLINQN